MGIATFRRLNERRAALEKAVTPPSKPKKQKKPTKLKTNGDYISRNGG